MPAARARAIPKKSRSRLRFSRSSLWSFLCSGFDEDCRMPPSSYRMARHPMAASHLVASHPLCDLDRHLAQHAPGEAKAQSQVGFAQTSYDPDIVCRGANQERVFRMARLDGVPVLGNVEIGSLEKVPHVADDQVVD